MSRYLRYNKRISHLSISDKERKSSITERCIFLMKYFVMSIAVIFDFFKTTGIKRTLLFYLIHVKMVSYLHIYDMIPLFSSWNILYNSLCNQ